MKKSNHILSLILVVLIIGIVSAPLNASQSLVVSPDGYIDYSEHLFNPTLPYSVQIWAKDTDPIDDYYSWFWGFDYSITMGTINNSTIGASMSNSTGGTPSVPYFQNTWVHTVLVYEGGNTWKVYVDGIAYTYNPTNPYTAMIQGLTIGARGQNSANEDFAGELDDFAIWNKALSQAEITSLYNGGVGRPAEVDGGSYASSGHLTVYVTFENEIAPVIGSIGSAKVYGAARSFVTNSLNTSLLTTPAGPIPVMSLWGLVWLSALLGLLGIQAVRKQAATPASEAKT